ncbi:MAG TPA: GNAT family N-acetyltransferase [Myxococcota bacterium]|nr:GNAT family N-acetyltransferase [Myxococcota bacterium]
MYTEVARPDELSSDELDDYLARGWYRMRQALFTCRFVTHSGRLVPAIWTRSRLEDLQLTRNQNKRMKRIRALFERRIGDVIFSAEHEEIYRRYREHVGGDRPEDLDQLLGSQPGIFDTRLLELRHGGELAAFSLFDRGRHAIQSVAGIFDPRFAKHSLGIATMLLEVLHAQELGLRYHYAGYVLPGEPAMDYKLRVPQLEWWEPESRRWRPIEQLAAYDLPDRRLRAALARAEVAANARGVVTRVMPNPRFDLGAWNAALSACLSHPIVLACRTSPREVLVVGYHLDLRAYELLRCTPGTLQDRHGESTGELVFVVRERVARSRSPEFIAQALGRS